jgi:hypothetical protein
MVSVMVVVYAVVIIISMVSGVVVTLSFPRRRLGWILSALEARIVANQASAPSLSHGCELLKCGRRVNAMKPTQKYDVAISYAGEDRQYAEALADALKSRNVRFFYDKYETAALWGKNLYTHLTDIYQNGAHYCVMFLSQHYAKKVWTNHEREAAQARAFQEHEDYILPIRLDDTEIPGILPTIGYLKWSAETPETIADAILSKLKEASQLPGLPTGKQGGSEGKPFGLAQKHSAELKPVRKIVRPWELRGVWNSFRVMSIDWQVNCLRLIEQEGMYTGDGYLARDALPTYIKKLESQRANAGGQGLWRRGSSAEETKEIDEQLAIAREILRDMEEVSADAIDFLPKELKGFPDYLRRLATELLMKDDTKADLEINQFILDNARSRYHTLPERTTSQKRTKEEGLERISELAKKLGLY